MGAKSNASTTGSKVQELKPIPGFEWKFSHCSYTNEEEMLRANFGDTDEGGQICIICYYLCLQSSDEVLLAKK